MSGTAREREKMENIHLNGNPEEVHLLEILLSPSTTSLCVHSTGVPLKQSSTGRDVGSRYSEGCQPYLMMHLLKHHSSG